MNIIDRAIAGLFPVWGAKRALARYALRSYDASNTAERLRARKPPLVTGPIEEGRLNREKLAAIARDLDRNNSWAHGVFNSLANNIVGSGFKPQATIRKRRGNGLDQKTNDRIEDAWRRWADSADITGKRSIYDLQWLAEREQWVTGEVLAIRVVPNDGRRIPLALDFVESERLSDLDGTTRNGGRIVQGVEFNSSGSVVAYHIYPNHPNDTLLPNSTPQRIPADRVLHVFTESRANQVRGLSRIGPVATTFTALSQYFDFELTRARISSAFVGAVKKQGGFTFPSTGDSADLTDDNLNDIGYIEGGMLVRLKPGESLDFSSPNIQTAFESFITTMLRSMAVGLNVSYELLARDFTKTNFSSARQSALEDRKHWEPRQQRIIHRFNRPVWGWFVEALAATGMPEMQLLPLEAFTCKWQTPGWPWVDPQKEVDADKEAIRAGIDSPQRVAAKRGLVYADLVEENRVAKEASEAAGLTLDIFQPKGGGGGGAPEAIAGAS
jgi:lambda family phage portal protein